MEINYLQYKQTFAELKLDDCLPITDILIAPSPYCDKLKQGLELLLKSEEYEGVKIVLSKIPYIP